MSDVFSPQKRSEVMSRIRSKGNAATELRMIALMKESGIKGWRRNSRLMGKPDFVFPKARMALFVDGCFWHGCPKHATRPKQNREFWDTKLARNKARDRDLNRSLKKSGWKVMRIWEHSLKTPGAFINRLRKATGKPRCDH